MNNPTPLSDIEISEPLLEGVIGHYCDTKTGAEEDEGVEIRTRMQAGGDDRKQCMDAAAEAVILSQLIATVTEESAFQAVLADLNVLKDDALRKLRLKVFDEGYDVCIESLAGTDGATRASIRVESTRLRLAQS